MKDYPITKAQEEFIPDLIRLQKMAAEMNIKIEAMSSVRLRNGMYEPDYKVVLLGTDCYSNSRLYEIMNKRNEY